MKEIDALEKKKLEHLAKKKQAMDTEEKVDQELMHFWRQSAQRADKAGMADSMSWNPFEFMQSFLDLSLNVAMRKDFQAITDWFRTTAKDIHERGNKVRELTAAERDLMDKNQKKVDKHSATIYAEIDKSLDAAIKAGTIVTKDRERLRKRWFKQIERGRGGTSLKLGDGKDDLDIGRDLPEQRWLRRAQHAVSGIKARMPAAQKAAMLDAINKMRAKGGLDQWGPKDFEKWLEGDLDEAMKAMAPKKVTMPPVASNKTADASRTKSDVIGERELENGGGGIAVVNAPTDASITSNNSSKKVVTNIIPGSYAGPDVSSGSADRQSAIRA